MAASRARGASRTPCPCARWQGSWTATRAASGRPGGGSSRSASSSSASRARRATRAAGGIDRGRETGSPGRLRHGCREGEPAARQAGGEAAERPAAGEESERAERGLPAGPRGEQGDERAPAEATGPRSVPLDERARRLDQRAVRHARGAGRLACPAAEAEIEVPHDLPRRPERALLERAHEMDASARRVRLRAELEVGRARREAEPAVHAGIELLVVDEAHRQPARASLFPHAGRDNVALANDQPPAATRVRL